MFIKTHRSSNTLFIEHVKHIKHITMRKFFIRTKHTLELVHDLNEPLDPFVLQDITHLTFGNNYNYPIVLTKNILCVIFGKKFTQSIVLSKYVNRILFSDDFTEQIILTKYMAYLESGCDFNNPIVLTKHMVYLEFGYWFNQPIELSKNMMYLKFSIEFNQSVILSKKITHLNLGFSFNQPIILTPRLCCLKFGYAFEFEQSNIFLTGVRCLSFGLDDESFDHLENGARHYIVDFNHEMGLEKLPLAMVNVPNDVKKISVSSDGFMDTYVFQNTSSHDTQKTCSLCAEFLLNE